MPPPLGSDPKWHHVTCPKCRSYGFLNAIEYGEHLTACKGVIDWKRALTPDDVIFLRCNRIDPEVESE